MQPPLSNIEQLVLVTGVSGAGKSAAIDTLEDLGFASVENLPVALLRGFLDLSSSSPSRFSFTALSLDLSSPEKQEQFLRLLEEEPALSPPKVQIVYLDCKTDTIVKRYGQTRRPHPAFEPQQDLTLEEAIAREKRRLFPVRERAQFVLDTSDLNIHELQQEVRAFVDSLLPAASKAMRVNFLSFGFKHGVPIDCDLLIDVRFLPNPYFVDALRARTGLDREVAAYIMQHEAAREFVKRYLDVLTFLLPHYANGGKTYLNIGVGCTGGRHRSVALSELLSQELGKKTASERYLISVKHRDVERHQ